MVTPGGRDDLAQRGAQPGLARDSASSDLISSNRCPASLEKWAVSSSGSVGSRSKPGQGPGGEVLRDEHGAFPHGVGAGPGQVDVGFS